MRKFFPRFQKLPQELQDVICDFASLPCQLRHILLKEPQATRAPRIPRLEPPGGFHVCSISCQEAIKSGIFLILPTRFLERETPLKDDGLPFMKQLRTDKCLVPRLRRKYLIMAHFQPCCHKAAELISHIGQLLRLVHVQSILPHGGLLRKSEKGPGHDMMMHNLRLLNSG
ncbi:uncharacterized protein BCR38DRAFT_420191 [Pseudomassariella vexata]|uniref:Uncharacterized protein n=1 Tax=Pseudomassariella vexata TaxID=1141098 RepID=A0A1Y2EE27_9PEZI|nr:uncharacterized protein BCR38DRAFT_420191 [Pseudomassariella vexata]ORY69831.1 hypothetical protein BCR38DRAFT_420191 [Pseudomassariella vexata]